MGSLTYPYEAEPELDALIRLVSDKLAENAGQRTGPERERYLGAIEQLAAPYVLSFHEEILRLREASKRLNRLRSRLLLMMRVTAQLRPTRRSIISTMPPTRADAGRSQPDISSVPGAETARSKARKQ